MKLSDIYRKPTLGVGDHLKIDEQEYVIILSDDHERVKIHNIRTGNHRGYLKVADIDDISKTEIIKMLTSEIYDRTEVVLR